MTDILAIDLATRTGYARGPHDGVPTSGSVWFAPARARPGQSRDTSPGRNRARPGQSRDAPHATDHANMVFANAMAWIGELLAPPLPDMLIVEALLPGNAKRGFTSKAVHDRLAGLHGIVRAVAFSRGVREIVEAEVGAIRAHFISDRTCKRKTAKAETMRRCQILGWAACDDNAADALALWSYAASLIDPRLALRVSPLFQRRAAG